MTNGHNERMDRVEANLDRLAAMIIQTAERQSTLEHFQEKTNAQIDKILAAVAADGENIRALARIAEAH